MRLLGSAPVQGTVPTRRAASGIAGAGATRRSRTGVHLASQVIKQNLLSGHVMEVTCGFGPW